VVVLEEGTAWIALMKGGAPESTFQRKIISPVPRRICGERMKARQLKLVDAQRPVYERHAEKRS
jgi:hypothetical protein